MGNRSKDLIVRAYIKINGEFVLWDSLPEPKRKEIGLALNDRALRTIGYVPTTEKTA
jgi:hypothetical protein